MSQPPLVRATSAAPDADLLIRRVHVLDPGAGVDAQHDVLIRGGVVAELGAPGWTDAPPGTEEVDGAGRTLLPGFVDPHVHLRSPGQEHKEDLGTGTAAAAAGGYVAVVAMPNTSPVIDSVSVLRSLRDAATRHARVPVGFMPAITKGLQGEELTEMAELRGAGALGFTDDGRPVRSAGMLRRALRYQRLAGGVLALHEEDPTLSAGGHMREGVVSARLGIGGVPSISESTFVARDAAIAEHEDGRLHFQHLSCVASVEAVAAAKGRGVAVTCEASPHHLCLTDEAVRGLDPSTKMNPPLGHETDRQALIDGLRSGTVDCVATDHAPHAPDEKAVPFEQAPMGTTGLESAFAVLHDELVRPGILDLATLVARFTAGATVAGLPVPEIRLGARANAVLVDLDHAWTIGEDGYASRSSNCCFDGRRVTGRVLMTVADGTVAHRAATLAAVPEPRP